MTTQRWTLVEAAILHARTPAQTIGGTGNSLHSPRPLNPSEATELLSDDTPLKLALKLNIDVLEVATPTLSRHWAWRNNAMRIGRDDVDSLSKPVRSLRYVGQPNPDLLPRQRAADEDYPAIETRHAITTVSDIAHAKVEFIALGRTNRLMHLSKSKALGGISTPGSDGGTRITPRTRIVTLPTLFENRRATQLVRN